MPTSFQLKGIDIVGWQTGRAVPTGNVECTSQDLADYDAAQRQMAADRRRERPQWVSDAVVIPADTRPEFEVIADRADDTQLGDPVLEADDVDSITITFRKMNGRDVDTTFNETIYYPLGERKWRLIFAAGVATKVYKTAESLTLIIDSVPDMKLSEKLTLISVE